MMLRRDVLGLAAGGLGLAAAGEARADDCAGTSLQSLSDPRALHKVTLSFVAKQKKWQAIWTEGSSRQETMLAGPGDHAHLVLAVPHGTPKFAVIETSAGHELDGRVRIYEPNGKLVRALGLKELLTRKELDQAGRSISHLHWLSGTPSLGSDGGSVDLPLVGGRTKNVSIAAPPAR